MQMGGGTAGVTAPLASVHLLWTGFSPGWLRVVEDNQVEGRLERIEAAGETSCFRNAHNLKVADPSPAPSTKTDRKYPTNRDS